MFAAMYHFRKLSKVRVFASLLKKKIISQPSLKDRVDMVHVLEINDKMLRKFSEFGIWNVKSEFDPLVQKLEKLFLNSCSQELEAFKNDKLPLQKMLDTCMKMDKEDPAPLGMDRLTDSLIYQGCLDFRQLIFFRAMRSAIDRIFLDLSVVDDRRVSRKLAHEMELKITLIMESIDTEEWKFGKEI